LSLSFLFFIDNELLKMTELCLQIISFHACSLQQYNTVITR